MTTTNPCVSVDFNTGEGSFSIGTRLAAECPLKKVDVLGDIVAQTEAAFDAAYEELYPGVRARSQRTKNLRRRELAESLAGTSIEVATPLKNGDLALTLSDGRVLVFCSEREDIDIRGCETLAQAVKFAKTTCLSSYYTNEPTAADRKHQSRDGQAMRVNKVLGIRAPV